MKRNEHRSDFPDHARIVLLEQDMDALQEELRQTNRLLSKILWTMVGLLVSTTGASIILAIRMTADVR